MGCGHQVRASAERCLLSAEQQLQSDHVTVLNASSRSQSGQGERLDVNRASSVRIVVLILVAGIAVGLPGVGVHRSLGGVLIPEPAFFGLAPELAEDQAGPDFTLDDRWNQTFTWFDYNGRTVCRGHLPKWNPNELGGSPYLAVGSTSALSPFVLATCPFPRGQRVFVATVLEFWVAAFGMFGFLRYGLRLAAEAAGMGALTFALSGTAIAYAFFPHGFTGSWIGLLALLAVLIRRSSGRSEVVRWGVLYAFVVALCGFSGQPEMLAITVGGALVAAHLVRVLPLDGPRRASVALVVFSLAGAALAAVQLLPTATYSLGSALAQSRDAPAGFSALAPGNVLTGVKQYAAGMLLGAMEPGFQGPPGPGPTATSALPWSRTTLYMGSAVFVTSIVIVAMLSFGRIGAAWRPMGRSLHLRFLLAALLASVVALKFPVTQFLISRLPIASQLDVNLIRWIAVFFFAVFTSLAFRTIATRRFTKLFLVVLTAVNVLLLVAAVALSKGLRNFSFQLAKAGFGSWADQWQELLTRTWRIHLVVAVLGLLLLGIPRLHRVAPFAAVALVALEMVGVQAGVVNRWAEVYPVADAARAQLAQVRQSGERVIGIGTVNPTLGTLLGVPAMSGYTVMTDSHVALAEGTESCKTYVAPVLLELCGYPPSPRSIGEFGNVGWVLGPRDLASPDLTASGKIGEFMLYRSTMGLGQAFFVRGTNCDDYQRAQVKGLDSSMRLDDRVSVSRDSASSLSFSFDRRPQRRCLFVSESYAEGWSARNARSESRPVIAFAGVWQAVDVAPGDDTIRLAYDPPGYSVGLKLTVFTMVFLVLLAGWTMTEGLRRRRPWSGRMSTRGRDPSPPDASS